MVAVTTHMEMLTKWICLGGTVIRAKRYCAEENTSFHLSREDFTQGPGGHPELTPVDTAAAELLPQRLSLAVPGIDQDYV